MKTSNKLYNPLHRQEKALADLPEFERGRLRSQESKIQRKAEAIQRYCSQCKKETEECASCPFQEFKAGQGNPGSQIFRRHCYACMEQQRMLTGRCQRYSCPVYPFSIKKSRSLILKELKELLGG